MLDIIAKVSKLRKKMQEALKFSSRVHATSRVHEGREEPQLFFEIQGARVFHHDVISLYPNQIFFWIYRLGDMANLGKIRNRQFSGSFWPTCKDCLEMRVWFFFGPRAWKASIFICYNTRVCSWPRRMTFKILLAMIKRAKNHLKR